jgi:predicted membrane protein
MFMTPHLTSAMAMFGFVYLWYLMLVLLLEIYFEYRRDMIVWSTESTGPKKWALKILSLFSTDISEKAVAFDKKTVKIITIIGIPSAFLLHGYVGFIFGSIKANPWWSSVMMPVVFLFSAIVSGIAMVMLLYMVVKPLLGGKIDMKCLDTMASFLFYAVIVDFSIEVLDFIHRLYESEESIKILSQLVTTKLFMSLVVLQILLGMLLPLAVMAMIKVFKLQEEVRKLLYFVCGLLIQLGIFSTRWNVVIGGQLFSKSFRGLTTYKMELTGIEGFLVALALLIVPFVILAILIKLLPPWKKEELARG